MIRYTILVLFLVAVGFAAWIFSNKLLNQEVVVEPVVIDTARATVLGTVTVKADYSTEIRSGESGRLLEVLIEEIQEVIDGDIVARIDTRDLKLDLEARQIDLDLAQQRLLIGNPMRFNVEVAQESLDEINRLYDLGQRSERQVKAAERTLIKTQEDLELSDLNARSEIRKLENSIKIMNRRLDKMTIRSSIDGIINDVIREKGDLIRSGDPIASIISKKRVVVAEVSEEQFSGLKIGQQAVVRFLSLGGVLYDAEVLKIFPSADPDTQRYSIQLKVEISQDLLKPGLTGEVTITTGVRENANIIPTRALMGDHVFVYNDGRLEYRQIIFGYRGLTQVEVTEGLEEGELVVVENLDALRPGDRAKIVEKKNILSGR
jgi:RND family efflux transporter MFP subunit